MRTLDTSPLADGPGESAASTLSKAHAAFSRWLGPSHTTWGKSLCDLLRTTSGSLGVPARGQRARAEAKVKEKEVSANELHNGSPSVCFPPQRAGLPGGFSATPCPPCELAERRGPRRRTVIVVLHDERRVKRHGAVPLEVGVRPPRVEAEEALHEDALRVGEEAEERLVVDVRELPPCRARGGVGGSGQVWEGGRCTAWQSAVVRFPEALSPARLSARRTSSGARFGLWRRGSA